MYVPLLYMKPQFLLTKVNLHLKSDEFSIKLIYQKYEAHDFQKEIMGCARLPRAYNHIPDWSPLQECVCVIHGLSCSRFTQLVCVCVCVCLSGTSTLVVQVQTIF